MIKQALSLTIPLLLVTALPARAQLFETVLQVVNGSQANAIVQWKNESTGWATGNVGVASGQTSEHSQGWDPSQNPIQDFRGSVTVPGRGCMVTFRVRMTFAAPGSGAGNSLAIENVHPDSHGLACTFVPQCTSVASDASTGTCTATIMVH